MSGAERIQINPEGRLDPGERRDYLEVGLSSSTGMVEVSHVEWAPGMGADVRSIHMHRRDWAVLWEWWAEHIGVDDG